MRFTFAASALCLLSTLAGPSAADQITVYGAARTYTIVQPAAKGPQPTIIMLHDAKGTGTAIAHSTKLGTLAPQEGFVAVFPDGVRQQWNFFLPGKELDFFVRTSKASGGVPDDGVFLKSLIDDLVRRGIADPRRIYITGESNGSLMALRMLCTDANLFAGAALLAPAMPETLGADCHPSRPVPILLIKGTKDEVLPYGGGLVEPEETFRIWSTDRLISFLQQINGDSGTPQSSLLPRKVPNVVAIDRWTACPGTPLTLYRVIDGPHIAPADLNEGQVVLDFFSSPPVTSPCVAALQPPSSGAGSSAGPNAGSNGTGSGTGPADGVSSASGSGSPSAGKNNPSGTGPDGSSTSQGPANMGSGSGSGSGTGASAADPNAPGGLGGSSPGGNPGGDTAGLGPPSDGSSGSNTAGLGPPPDGNPGSNTAGLGPPPDSNSTSPTGGLGPPPDNSSPGTATALIPPAGNPPVYSPNPGPTGNSGTGSCNPKPQNPCNPCSRKPPNLCSQTPQSCNPPSPAANVPMMPSPAKAGNSGGVTASANTCNKPALVLRPNPCATTANPLPPAGGSLIQLRPQALPPPMLPTNTASTSTGNVCAPKPTHTQDSSPTKKEKKEVERKPPPRNNHNNDAANAAAAAATATAILGIVGGLGHHHGGGGGGGGGFGGGGGGGNVCHHH